MNYQKELDKLIESLDKREYTLLLHSCCAPCSSYVLEYLRQYFAITVFYYNPNITDKIEYKKRVEEQKRLIHAMNTEHQNSERMLYQIAFAEGAYEPESFFKIAKGFETCKEGTQRCFLCYELRLRASAILAKAQGFDYVTTTLTISPLKNAEKLNQIGEALAEEYGIKYLPSDFKKKNGYRRSVELSEKYDLYRQDYCGCVYSRKK